MGIALFTSSKLAFVTLLLSALCVLMAQQRTGSLSGTVRDQSGASVPGATISVKRIGGGTNREVATDADGAYRFPSVEPGEYEVSAAKDGFKTGTHKGIILELDRETVVNHTLEVGERTETVVVSGQARIVEATSSVISSLVDGRTIEELPLNGRDYLQLATLQAGTPVARTQSNNVNTGYGLQFSVSGGRPYQNAFVLDGLVLTTYHGSAPGSINGVTLGVDAVREFTLLSSAYSAEYGRAGAGIINAVTRSGGNELHGSLFYFHRNDGLDARNFFDVAGPPEFRRHQFGASAGGPVERDGSFFFLNYEGLREVRGNTTINTTLTAEAKLGMLSTGTVAVDPIMKRVADLYPLPNGEILGDTGLFVFPNDENGTEDFVTARFDRDFGDFDKLFARYTSDDAARLDETNFALGKRTNSTRMQSFVVEESHAFSVSLLNIARLGIVRSLTTSGQTETQVAATDDASLAFLPGGRAIGFIEVAGLSDFPGGTGSLDSDIHALTSLQGSNDLTWITRRHTVKFGGRLERTRFNTDSQNRGSGEYRFLGLRQFLTNSPGVFRAQLPGSDTVRGWRQWNGALYVQDKWRIASRLTMDLGLRHEWASTPREVNGKVSNLDELTSPTMRVGEPLFENPSLGNLSPRAGLAWDLWGNGGTVLRSGYGIYPDLILSQYLLLFGVRNPPFFRRGSTNALGLGDFPKGGYAVLAADPAGDLRVERIPRRIEQPYVQHWNLNVEQRLSTNAAVRIAYVGSHGLNLSSIVQDANVIDPVVLPDGRLYFPPGGDKPNSFFSVIKDRRFDAHSFYHGLQAQFRRRFSRAFESQVSYSNSKSIDDSSNFFERSESANYGPLPYNGGSRYNRGLSTHDVRHFFVASGLWVLPSPGRRAWDIVLGDWQAGWIATYASGLPITARLAYDAAGTTTGFPDHRSGQRPDLAPGASKNPTTGDPNRWVDISACRRPQAGFLGNLGRNTIIGPDRASVDFSLVKRVPVTRLSEGASLELRAEFFNLLNRTNFDPPSQERMEVFTRTSTREDVGRITSAGKSREIQFGLKLRF